MGDATPLSLPGELPWPITITRLVVSPGASVRRGDRLIEYSFMSATKKDKLQKKVNAGNDPSPEEWKDDMVGSWESPIEGTVEGWTAGVSTGMRIEQRQGKKSVIKIEQPCTHPVQIHGMCGICGADLTAEDYLSQPKESNKAGPSRYPGSFEMAHDSLGVTVSTDEARRLDSVTRNELLDSRRLALIVDLDQTIIHTTVDPTVGEWMTEIEEEKAEDDKQAKAASEKGKTDEETTTPPGSPVAAKKERNPNAGALADVARFQLADDVPSGGGSTSQPVRWYYTKPRPGLTGFLDNMSKRYEMHVYTMGTRTYADAICKVVDPDGKIFGGRIISRDESGSMSSKSLMRLFPTDQSMVVIIDDRSDVWGDSPNLVKVIPYDFFVGIGDINGAFLPPTKPTVSPIPGQPTPASSPGDIPSTDEGLARQAKLLDELAENRPLAKLEEEIGHEEEDDDNEDGPTNHEVNGASPAEEVTQPESATDEGAKEDRDAPKGEHEGEDASASAIASDAGSQTEQQHHHHHHHHHHRRALLNDNDYELNRISKILTHIHDDYYQAYDERDQSSSALPLQCDTPLLIEEMKDQVLRGCVIVFTGVIPRTTKPEKSEIWQLAEQFGAVCDLELSDRVTHVVTAATGTEKMYKAARMPNVRVVWLAWLQQSIAEWKHIPEGAYLALGETGTKSSPPSRPDSPKNLENGDSGGPPDLGGWDDAAQAEFDKFLAEGSDTESEGDGDDDSSSGSDTEEGKAAALARRRERSPSRWSRAATPGPSILSSRAATPDIAEPKHVRYADEENLPLEEIRQPQPTDIPSYPPRKKRKLFMLSAPSSDDEVPEENKMVYKDNSLRSAHQPEGDRGGEGAGGSSDAEAASEDDDDEDEFAKMLADSMADAA